MKKNDQDYFSGESSFSAYASEQKTYSDFGVSKAWSGSRTFNNYENNISVKSEYLRGDYNYFRNNESAPKRIEDIIKLSMDIYDNNGIVRNFIDLLSDFASQGIRLQHPNPSLQRFYDVWSQKVGMAERSERLINTILKAGSAVVKKSNTTLNTKKTKKWKSANASDLPAEEELLNLREIPIRYTILPPTSFEVIGTEVATFINKPVYVLRVPTTFRGAVPGLGSYTQEYQKIIDEQIPADIKDSLKKNLAYVPIDQNKIEVYHYKKDDNQVWASPLIRPVLNDIIQLEKYKLADISALDGAISNIRLWTVGHIGDSPSNSLLPTEAALNKVRNILSNNVGGGVIDIVWGPELKFTESNSQVWRFLGASKYEAVLNAIYEGLGVPPSMRTSGKGTSGTVNYVGLNTLVKRLEYVRGILLSFWNKQLLDIHRAMGFSGKPPVITFDFMSFADEAAEKKLWIDLYDRRLVSSETIQEVFGRNPKFENQRVKREYAKMENGSMPDKAGPFHNAEKDHELKKILLQGGTVAPSEVGVELEEKLPGEKTAVEKMQKQQTSNFKSKKPAGRPLNVTETSKRKPRPKGKPTSKAAVLSTWANSSYHKISEYATPVYLKAIGKKNMRTVSSEEAETIEYANFSLLCSLEPFTDIDETKVYSLIENPTENHRAIASIYSECKQTFIELNGREPTVEEVRGLYSSSYALFHESEKENVED